MSYQNNLLALEQRHPLLSIKLKRCEPMQKVEQGFLDLNEVRKESVIFIYRLASLISFKELYKALEMKNIQIFIIEKAIEEFAFFLSLKEIEALLKHPNIEWYLLEDFYEELYHKIAWQSVFLKVEFITAFEEDAFFSFKEKMQQYVNSVFLIASEYSDYGRKVIENFYQNCSSVQESKRASSLQFLKIPAIICGAGPSVTQQLDLLKTLEHKALIFAGGSVLSALSKSEVIPHFAAMVDPDPPYRRCSSWAFYETPFLYQMRLSSQILRLVHGQKILSGGSGEFSLDSYYLEIPPLESGWNVANFMATMAAEMGCDPIILIGMDMMYESHQEYIEGVEALESDGKKQGSLFKTIQGKNVFSRKDLLMGKTFFSELIQRYPHQKFINATKEGLFIENMKHSSFEEVLFSLEKEYDLKGIVHARLMEMEKIDKDKNSFKKIKEDLRRSFENAQNSIKQMLYKLEELYLYQKENLSTTISIEMLEAKLVLEEIELEQECVYQLYVEPLWHIWKWVLFRGAQKEIQTLEGKIRQLLFFKEVIEEHKNLFNQCIEGHKVYERRVLSF